MGMKYRCPIMSRVPSIPYKKLVFTFISLLMAFSATAASADILLFDLNVSELEVQGAKAAAAARGENLIVYPDLPDSNRKQIEQYSSREVQVHDRLYEITLEVVKPGLSNSQIVDLYTEESKLSGEEESIRAARAPFIQGYTFDYEDLDKLFAKLAQDKVQLSSVIVSAHAGPGIFQGLVATFSTNQLNHSLQQYVSASHDSIHSLLLWGCYTATLNDLQFWKAAVPSADLIFGFGVIAPSGIRPASGLLLEDVLRKESVLATAPDISMLSKEFEDLQDVKLTSAAAAIKDTYFEVGSNPVPLNTQPSCAKLLAAYTKDQPIYEKYSLAQDDDYENPPADPHHSDLRDYYSAIQEGTGCSLLQSNPSAFSEMPSENNILALIFFDNVRKNFAAYFHDQIAAENDVLAKAGVAADSRFLDFSSDTLTRKTVINQLMVLNVTGPLDDAGQNLASQESNLLIDLNCVPFSWETDEPTPGIKPQDPNCASQ
jgi:hypothetical protein